MLYGNVVKGSQYPLHNKLRNHNILLDVTHDLQELIVDYSRCQFICEPRKSHPKEITFKEKIDKLVIL